MSRKYQINELVDILGITRTAVNRKVSKYSFNTVHEYVNGRKMKLVLISDEELQALQHEVGMSRQKNTVLGGGHDTHLNNSPPGETLPKQRASGGSSDKLVEQIVSLSETVQKQSDTVQQFVDRMVNAEKRVYLLENLENRHQEAYVQAEAQIKELTARNAQLREENEQLKAEIQRLNSRWWKKKIF